MNKPISMIIRETQANIIDTINKSGLPIDVVALLIDEVSRAVHREADLSYQNDIANFHKEESEVQE